MENKRIVYENGDGSVAIIVPTTKCGLAVDDIAMKDVPAGTPYWIVDASEVPSDRTFRAAWEVDFNRDPDGVGIGSQAWFELKSS